MVKKLDHDLITDIIKLQVLEVADKKEIVDQLTEKYSVNETTIYRNISKVDSYIQDRVNLLHILSVTSLNEGEFKDQYDGVKKALTS